MKDRCRLKSPEGVIQSIDGVLCDWYFSTRSLDLLRNLDDRSLVATLLDFRKVFPLCSGSMDMVSRRLRLLLGSGYCISVELEYDTGERIVRTVCLDAGYAPVLDNSL